MTPYHKLVRDKIPAQLDAKGVAYEKTVASPEEYKSELIKKLLEEANEFLADESIEELADVCEVVAALRTLPEYADVESARLKKLEERGGFAERFILKGEK